MWWKRERWRRKSCEFCMCAKYRGVSVYHLKWDRENGKRENSDKIGLTKIKTKNNIYFVSKAKRLWPSRCVWCAYKCEWKRERDVCGKDKGMPVNETGQIEFLVYVNCEATIFITRSISVSRSRMLRVRFILLYLCAYIHSVCYSF